MFWIAKLYDKRLLTRIKEKYTHKSNSECILRGLSSGDVKVSDVKCLKIEGFSGCPPEDEYILINNIKRRGICHLERKDSGNAYSHLRKVSLYIKDGKGIITEYWVCA